MRQGGACVNGADVVVAVGGDGTVRTVASAMSGTGHAMGIIPIGTGNLFARNMGIPIDDIDAALTVATSHGSRHVDVGRSLLDDPKADHGHAFLIIAGVGFDAAMIDDTDPQLKKNISWLAYFVGGVKNLFTPKYRGDVTITSTDGSMHTRHGVAFRTFMAGNCGQIPVFADAQRLIRRWHPRFRDHRHVGRHFRLGEPVWRCSAPDHHRQALGLQFTVDEFDDGPDSGSERGDHAGEAGAGPGRRRHARPCTRHLRFTVDREALCVRVPEVAPDMSATERPPADSRLIRNRRSQNLQIEAILHEKWPLSASFESATHAHAHPPCTGATCNARYAT